MNTKKAFIGSLIPALVFSALLVFSPSSACAQEAEEATLAELKDFLDNPPKGWTTRYGTIDYDRENDTIIVNDLVMQRPEASFTFRVDVLETGGLNPAMLAALRGKEKLAGVAVLAEEIYAHGVVLEEESEFRVDAKQASVKNLSLLDALHPASADVSFHELVIATISNDVADAYQGLSYDTPPVFDGGGHYRFDPAKKTMRLERGWLGAEKVGRLDLDFRVVDYVPPSEEARGDGKLADFRLDYKDDSLVGRIFDYVGAEQGQSGKEVQQTAVAFLAMLRMTAGLKSPRLGTLIQRTTAFLNRPHSFSLSLRPQPPLALDDVDDLMDSSDDPDAIIERLGVELTVNR